MSALFSKRTGNSLRQLTGVPGITLGGGDHPVFGDLAGDPPPPVGAVTALGRLDVLPGDQGQQRQRGSGPLIQVTALEHIALHRQLRARPHSAVRPRRPSVPVSTDPVAQRALVDPEVTATCGFGLPVSWTSRTAPSLKSSSSFR
jgi:hypothetical protein